MGGYNVGLKTKTCGVDVTEVDTEKEVLVSSGKFIYSIHYGLEGTVIRYTDTQEELEVVKQEENPPQPPSETERLKQENAFLFLELAKATERAEASEQASAALTLELVMKGVL